MDQIGSAVLFNQGGLALLRDAWIAAEFAVIILFSLPAEGLSVAEAAGRITLLRSHELFINAREALTEPGERPPAAQPAEIIASGADQPGIIDVVTLLLFQHQINIESMDYDVESAPMSGQHLFRMTATVAVPSDVDVDALRDKFRAMEAEFHFDILFHYPLSP